MSLQALFGGGAVAALLLWVALAAPVMAADEPLWEFDGPETSEAAAVDHSAWQALLDARLVADHPSGVNRFDYADVSAAERQSLDAYIDRLAALDPTSLGAFERFAYWVNLYNALTIQVVLEAYPVDSIREINASWAKAALRLGPWDDPVVTINATELTLNDIEHRILRPLFGDPRIHYAVNCASIGCPNLAPQAYTAANADALLSQGAHDYINHPRGVRFAADGDLIASGIFDWYAADFGADQAALIAHWLQYAEPELAARLKVFKGDIDYDYDWSLNQP